MIDFDAINDIIDDNIIEVLNELNIEYRIEGEYISINCPFHDNADGFKLKYRNKIWYCFSKCRCVYSTLKIICETLDLSTHNAIKWACNICGVSDDNFTIDKEKFALRGKLKKLKNMRLKRDEVVFTSINGNAYNTIEFDYHHEYALKRFKKSTLEYFRVGFSRIGELENRVCFTIDAPNGEIISVSGRSIYDDISPKYHILNGTDKGDTLYNISRLNEDNYVIVVEGFNSCLSLYEWGFNNVIATMGSSLTGNQKRLLLGLGKHIYIIGDNDIAGERMAQGIYNQCYKYANVTIIDMKEFTDIDTASPCEEDLGFDCMVDFTGYLEGVIKV